MTDVLVDQSGGIESIDHDVVIAVNNLLQQPDILKCFAEDVASAGLVGEERTVKLIYLALTSRLLEKPVSIKVEGPSSAGKSHTVEKCLKFFPDDAYLKMTGMSEKALLYCEESFSHRFIVVAEATGLNGDFQTYIIRSLLSEGAISYRSVDTSAGPQPIHLQVEGPTGLLVTTTRPELDAELETRMLSVPITDSPEQTRRVMRQLAKEKKSTVDYKPWRGLQRLIAESKRTVTIPFADALAELTPPVAVRLRRDFGAVLCLIRAHALLHQMSRDTNNDGYIVATLRDYQAVRHLIADLVADGIGASVSEPTRQTVDVVEKAKPDEVTVAAVAEALKLDKSSAHRRVQAAISKGYLQNLEERKGRPARLVLADSLPADASPLPSAEQLLQGVEAVTTPATAACNP